MSFFNLNAELAILGTILIDGLAFDEAVSEGISADDFYSPSNSIIFSAIEHLAKRGVATPDVILVAEHLESKNCIEDVGGRENLTSLFDHATGLERIADYAKLLRGLSQKRALLALSHSISDLCSEEADPRDVIDHISDQLAKIADSTKSSHVYGAGVAVRMAIEELKKKYTDTSPLWSTGLVELDKYIRPEPHRIYAVIGATGSGKTTLAQTMAEASLRQGYPVYYCSMEMTAVQMADRLIASAGMVDRKFLKNPKAFTEAKPHFDAVARASTQIAKYNDLLTIDATPAEDVHLISVKVKQWLRKQRKDDPSRRCMLIIDYLGLMEHDSSDIVNGLGAISAGLKRLTNEAGICTLLLAQVNRGVANRIDKRPTKNDIRDSGKVENDMDAVIGVYRPEQDNLDSEEKGLAEIIISKNRDGETGIARVRAELEYSRFSNLSSSMNYGNY